MGRSTTVLTATACGLALGSALTYFFFGRKKDGEGRSRSIPGLRGTPRGGGLRSRSAGSSQGRSASATKRSAYALAKLAQHGLDIEAQEHVGFLSSIMRELWPYIDKAGSKMVKDMMEPMFSEMLPGPLRSLKFIKLDLGEVPVQLDNVVVHKLADDYSSVQFDLDVIWDGECDIQMRSDYGLQFGVRSVKLSGRMSFLLCPLTEVLPVVSAIQYAFINPPDLELDFTGLAQVADFTIIDKTIRKMIQDIMAGMVVLPNRMLYKMDLANDYLKTHQPPLGIVNITAVRGRGFVIEKGVIANDIPDVYLLIQFGSSPTPWRTTTVWDDLNPVWNESAQFVLSDYDQAIKIHAWDEDKSPLDPDDDLGLAEMTVGDLLVAGGTAEVELHIDEEESGAFVALSCEVLPLITDNISSFDSDLCKGDNQLCGCLTILVTKAFDIPLKKEKAATFVKVSFDKQEFFTSVITEYPGLDALNPFYDAAFMVPLTADIVESSSNVAGVIEFNLMNDVDTILGTTTIKLADLEKLPGMTLQEKRKIGRGGASVELKATMYGVDLTTMPRNMGPPSDIANPATVVETPVRQITVPPSSNKSGVSPITRAGDMGKVSITAVRGRGFQVQKKAFKKDDVPDVYLKMKFGSGANKQKWRTSTVKDSVTPIWNESTTFALNDQDEVLTIDVYDQDKGVGDSDDYLGSAQVSVSDLLIAAKETEIPLAITKFGKANETGAFITIDCDMLGVELDSSFALSVESLGMSSASSVDSAESGQGSLVFGSRDFRYS